MYYLVAASLNRCIKLLLDISTLQKGVIQKDDTLLLIKVAEDKTGVLSGRGNFKSLHGAVSGH